LFRWFNWRVYHQIPSFLRLWKRDDVTNTVRCVSSSGEDRYQAVDSKSESSVRGSTGFQSLQQMNHFSRLLSQYLQYFPLNFSIVDANRSPSQFHSIEHEIEVLSCKLVQSVLLLYSPCVFFNGSCEGVVAGGEFSLFVSLEQ
ncbi:hypothetical protein PMAYCL1PPCAC_28648, partial [Pristionchus mayeri]